LKRDARRSRTGHSANRGRAPPPTGGFDRALVSPVGAGACPRSGRTKRGQTPRRVRPRSHSRPGGRSYGAGFDWAAMAPVGASSGSRPGRGFHRALGHSRPGGRSYLPAPRAVTAPRSG
jgi:hypothetical protein